MPVDPRSHQRLLNHVACILPIAEQPGRIRVQPVLLLENELLELLGPHLEEETPPGPLGCGIWCLSGGMG
jgi:hypothetical protein